MRSPCLPTHSQDKIIDINSYFIIYSFDSLDPASPEKSLDVGLGVLHPMPIPIQINPIFVAAPNDQ